jgi:hypothetical protein
MQCTLHRKVKSAVFLQSLIMKDLNEALTEITAIRRQIVRTAEFRGYGPITVATTGLVAIAAAVVQARFFPAAAHEVVTYLTLWISTAAIATSLIGFEMVIRSRTIHSSLGPEMTLHAIEQLVPSGVAGALVTAVLIRVAPDAVWTLPGLWQILFSLGVFASARFLPRAVFAVAAWYLFAGLVCLSWAATARTLSPWMMGLPYGIGQLLAAAILQWGETGTDGSFE